jgi:hypothetical protein
MEEKFKLDRTAFSTHSLDDADLQMRQHKNMSVKERFELLYFLNARIFSNC